MKNTLVIIIAIFFALSATGCSPQSDGIAFEVAFEDNYVAIKVGATREEIRNVLDSIFIGESGESTYSFDSFELVERPNMHLIIIWYNDDNIMELAAEFTNDHRTRNIRVWNVLYQSAGREFVTELQDDIDFNEIWTYFDLLYLFGFDYRRIHPEEREFYGYPPIFGDFVDQWPMVYELSDGSRLWVGFSPNFQDSIRSVFHQVGDEHIRIMGVPNPFTSRPIGD